MKLNTIHVKSFLALLGVCILIGCSGDNFGSVPVGGTVTMDGKPLAGVQVSFFPTATESTANVGPFSTGVTDAEGKFQLTTRYDKPGAVVGKHQVSFQYDGVDPEALDAAEGDLAEAKATGDDTSAAKSAVDDAKSLLKGRVKIPLRYTDHESNKLHYTVPAGGVENVLFELESK